MTPQEEYLELLKRAVLNTIYKDDNIGPDTCKYDPEKRRLGHSCPGVAHTMIGRLRLDNLHQALDNARLNNIPGDVIETGVWRGGASIFMRGYCKIYEQDRVTWVADSFEGLPPPNPSKYPVDLGSNFHKEPILKVSLEQVKENFNSYGLLDEKVMFLKGWFKDTLHTAPIDKLSVLRLDGDMYESTIQTLEALYDKLSPGGYILIDDYWITNCRVAVEDFRKSRNIVNEIRMVDWTGAYWVK